MVTSAASALAVSLVACTFCACTPVAPTPSPATATGADQGTSAALQPPADAALIEPVRTRVEHCRATGGGKLLVRVQKTAAGKLAFDVAPGSSLDPTEKRCVLEALSSLDIDESSTAWAGLHVRPTGFTSLLTIEW